jgi:hypothetical protein
MYRVYHLNVYKRSFPTRDMAVDWILNRVFDGGGRTAYGDYEILDESDF